MTSNRPKLLDLFCGAGGAAMGYHRAGFDVIGVDIKPQPRYPFTFIQGDALNPPVDIKVFDVIHASPPCQAWVTLAALHKQAEYPDLIKPTRELLVDTNKPYIIENVPTAPLDNPIMLCGTMFNLRVVRHRIFESNPVIWFAPATCCHWLKVVKLGRYPDKDKHFISVTGHFSGVKYAQEAMDIDWMGQKDLSQAIPPAYTEWIGRQLREVIHQ